ncbi:uncharacterized protein M6D78_015994 [Vipera latastei]
MQVQTNFRWPVICSSPKPNCSGLEVTCPLPCPFGSRATYPAGFSFWGAREGPPGSRKEAAAAATAAAASKGNFATAEEGGAEASESLPSCATSRQKLLRSAAGRSGRAGAKAAQPARSGRRRLLIEGNVSRAEPPASLQCSHCGKRGGRSEAAPRGLGAGGQGGFPIDQKQTAPSPSGRGFPASPRVSGLLPAAGGEANPPRPRLGTSRSRAQLSIPLRLGAARRPERGPAGRALSLRLLPRRPGPEAHRLSWRTRRPLPAHLLLGRTARAAPACVGSQPRKGDAEDVRGSRTAGKEPPEGSKGPGQFQVKKGQLCKSKPEQDLPHLGAFSGDLICRKEHRESCTSELRNLQNTFLSIVRISPRVNRNQGGQASPGDANRIPSTPLRPSGAGQKRPTSQRSPPAPFLAAHPASRVSLCQPSTLPGN